MRMNLKVARIRKNLTQEEIANMIGITRKTYREIEKGKQNPRFETMKKLSKVLEGSVDELFFSEE